MKSKLKFKKSTFYTWHKAGNMNDVILYDIVLGDTFWLATVFKYKNHSGRGYYIIVSSSLAKYHKDGVNGDKLSKLSSPFAERGHIKRYYSKEAVEDVLRDWTHQFVKDWTKSFKISYANPTNDFSIEVGAKDWGFGTFSTYITKTKQEHYVNMITRKPTKETYTQVEEFAIDTECSGIDRVKATFMAMIDNAKEH